MKAGELNRKIRIEVNTPTRDDAGDSIDSWSTLSTVWASMQSGSGGEKTEAEKSASTNVVTFRMYWLSGVSSKNRICYNSEYYNILGVSEIGYLEGMEIKAEKKDTETTTLSGIGNMTIGGTFKVG